MVNSYCEYFFCVQNKEIKKSFSLPMTLRQRFAIQQLISQEESQELCFANWPFPYEKKPKSFVICGQNLMTHMSCCSLVSILKSSKRKKKQHLRVKNCPGRLLISISCEKWPNKYHIHRIKQSRVWMLKKKIYFNEKTRKTLKQSFTKYGR